ncbi:MAG: (d)CMP kinase [Clostridiales bacterium]|nr:(d)CMP kinase [Clostridiales bacterium]
MSIQVAIDGPAGAGKSSVSKAVAAKLGFIYIDTGALYRTVALHAIRNGVSTSDVAVAELMKSADIKICYDDDGTQRIILNGEDVSEKIRTPKVSMGASDVAKIPRVRAGLLDLQRNLAKGANAVMDGRDIGTSILPDAAIKIFLTASVDARAKRRFDEYRQKGEPADLEAIKADIKKRDEQDMNRETAPLRQAEDAVLIDTSDMSFSQVVERIKSMIEKIL